MTEVWAVRNDCAQAAVLLGEWWLEGRLYGSEGRCIGAAWRWFRCRADRWRRSAFWKMAHHRVGLVRILVTIIGQRRCVLVGWRLLRLALLVFALLVFALLVLALLGTGMALRLQFSGKRVHLLRGTPQLACVSLVCWYDLNLDRSMAQQRGVGKARFAVFPNAEEHGFSRGKRGDAYHE